MMGGPQPWLMAQEPLSLLFISKVWLLEKYIYGFVWGLIVRNGSCDTNQGGAHQWQYRFLFWIKTTDSWEQLSSFILCSTMVIPVFVLFEDYG